MIFREATITDIPQMQIVRNSVEENVLSDPSMVTDKDCEEFLTLRGKGWACEADQIITGFSIIDLKEKNIWALFVRPEYEGNGIGKKLQELMLSWYFGNYHESLWLGTAPGTRAEKFYRSSGWIEVGKHGKGEIKFELTFNRWKMKKSLHG
ncbi:MAG: GNAT family N-acetyltransferase [Bacteroidia bacterium]|nr:GNAT family N-acetyltransferase [Bacteroidia bacterium]